MYIFIYEPGPTTTLYATDLLPLLQDTGPLFRHFKPRFPFGTDASLFKASKLNATFVFKKVAAPLTQLPKPVQRPHKPTHGKHA